MSEAIKPTPGVWRAEKGNIHTGFVATCQWDGDSWWEVWSDGWMHGGSAEANALLIAEAGTVFHETQCTPRQLVERVKELEELLNGVLLMGRGTSGRIIIEGWQEQVLRAALPNTVAEVK